MKFLEDIITYIENNYNDLIEIKQIDRKTSKIVIRIKILNLVTEEIELIQDKLLEISLYGIRILNDLNTTYYESIESLLQTIVPNTWKKYFQSKLLKNLMK